jgi:nucleotide-binding universal stress UspA family protein
MDMKKINMKKVLIAMDYDPTAQIVAETGYTMAKALGAEVILLHVISDMLYYSSVDYSPIMGFDGYMDMGPLQLETIDGLKKATEQFLNKTKHHLGDKAIQILIKEGDFSGSILEAAKEVNADIIVMGSHSRKWLENIVMGSVTEKVLHNTTIPMFIVPTRQK